MKLLFVLSQSLDSPSGLGRFGPLARELARLGHDVELLALHYAWAGLAAKSFVEEGVHVRYVGQMHVMKEGPRKRYFGPGRLLAVSLSSAVRLARAVSRSTADVIQLCKPQPINALAVRLGRRGRPVFCDCDDYEAQTNVFGGEWQRLVVRHFEDGVVGYARGLTTNTKFTFNRYRQLGFPSERIVYVPNGVERARFRIRQDGGELRRKLGLPQSAPVVVYVGTLSARSHAVDLLLAAFARVASQVPEARLLLVGGGEDYDGLRAQAERLGIGDRTLFAGRVSPAEAPQYTALGTVSVDPVRDDLVAKTRSPLKIVESLAVGVPVVTGDVGDRREMLADGRLGILVQCGDAEALADGLLALLQSSDLRARMSAAALQSREEWYWDRLVGRFAQVYSLGGIEVAAP